MRRFIEEQLIEWKNKINRKPLLVHGIRQVGKTWSIKNFGTTQFEEFIYINFDIEPGYSDLFKRSKDPQKILFELSILFEKKIDPAKTLLFFDEIQQCNEALNSLKYFEESEVDYFIIAAGSYLGITLSKGASFPVGKVDMIELNPLSFKEFLLASGQDMLVDYIEAIHELLPLPLPIFDKLNGYLREYFIVGGMPEAVKIWTNSRDFDDLEHVQRNIINAYYKDFSKYPPGSMIPKIVSIWDSIVSQLSKENRKFKYSEINKGARAREYETALEWLIAGKYLNKVNIIDKLLLPLRGYENTKHFKIYFPDTGLLRQMSGYPISSLINMETNENIQFKGALTENYVLQELSAIPINTIFYWSNLQYEIDFVVMLDDSIIPIEVKSGINVTSASMSKVLETQDIGVRISMKNLKKDGKLINIPLVLTSEIHRLVKFS